MQTSRKLLVLAALSASIAALCNADVPQAGSQENPSPSKAHLLKGWASETFNLPPSFAPSLPKGKESLRFAPGWNKPGSEGFWSYAFVMWIEERAPGAKRLDTLLEIYYNGILGSFAASAGKDISKTPARVDIKRVGSGRYEATMNAIDAFATFKPIKVRLLVESVPEGADRSSLRIQLSPQPKEHAVWPLLRAATADILEQDKPKPAAASTQVEKSAMTSFSSLVGGRWKTTMQAGNSIFDTWQWGPGRHSIRSMTLGTLPNGDPWQVIAVYFWHPERKEVRSLSVSPAFRGVSEGTIAFDGKKAEGRSDMFQTGFGHRPLATRWTFDGPERYRDELLDVVSSGLSPQNEWVRVRVAAAAPGERVGIPATGARAKPSALLNPLEKLLGTPWETDPKSKSGRTRTTFHYVPDADAIIGRVDTLNSNGTGRHSTDLYLYHHTGKQTLRWLALSGDGTVAEGDIASVDGGKALKLDLEEYRSGGTQKKEMRLDFGAEGTLRQRVWTLKGARRVLNLDSQLKQTR